MGYPRDAWPTEGTILHVPIGRRGAPFPCAGMLVWAGLPELAFFGRWTCIFLIALELSSIVLAVVFRFIEKPRPLVEYLPNPDHDARKLY